MNASRILLLTLIISLLSCNFDKEKGINLTGTVRNFNQDFFLIYSGFYLFPEGPVTDTAYVDETGVFKAKLTRGKGNTYQIPTQKGTISMFLSVVLSPASSLTAVISSS